MLHPPLPDIPWKSIIGRRNLLAHEYGEARVDRCTLLPQKKSRNCCVTWRTVSLPGSTKEAMSFTESDLVPVSALQHLLFCERQCALIHLEQQWVENRLTVGQL